MQTAQWTLVLGNSLAAGLLLFASFAKFVSPIALSRTLRLLTQHESLSTTAVVRIIGLVEFLVAICIMVPDLRLAAAAALGTLGIAFALSGIMARILHIAEPCGCFGAVTRQPLGLLNVFFGAILVAVTALNFIIRENLAAQYTVKLPVFTGILLCAVCLALMPQAARTASQQLQATSYQEAFLFVLFGVMLLLLAVAIGVLFAMCAELARRIGSSDGGTGTAGTTNYVLPVDRPGVYLRPDVTWPEEFGSIRSHGAFLLIVVSTACATCNVIADELGDGWAVRGADRLGLVISTPEASRGTAFVAEHGLAGIPHIIDEDGAWTTQSLGLSLSPVGLVFIDGRLHEPYVFNQVEPLWHKFTEDTLCTQESQAEPPGSLAAGFSRPSAPVA